MNQSQFKSDNDLNKTLEKEQLRATKLLEGKIVKKVQRHRINEVLIEFKDGTRFYIDSQDGELKLSITNI